MYIDDVKVACFFSSENIIGVRNLIKERQKYLFRSLLTKEKRHPRGVFFLLIAELRPPVADIRGRVCLRFSEVSRLCIPPTAVSCHARRCYSPYRQGGTGFAKPTPSGKLCIHAYGVIWRESLPQFPEKPCNPPDFVIY